MNNPIYHTGETTKVLLEPFSVCIVIYRPTESTLRIFWTFLQSQFCCVRSSRYIHSIAISKNHQQQLNDVGRLNHAPSPYREYSLIKSNKPFFIHQLNKQYKSVIQKRTIMPSAISFQIEEFGYGISNVFYLLCDSSVSYGFFNISLLSIKKARPHTTVEPTNMRKFIYFLW